MRILISGAGIAGPTLAYFLSLPKSSTITILEKATSVLSQGQNVDIEGSALKVIRKMGLIEEIRRFHTTERGTQFISPAGKPFAFFPVRKGGSASPTSEFEILRGDLAKVLFEATRHREGVEYRFETTITDIVEEAEGVGPLRVELSDGTTGQYDLLIAADGQWSKVRRRWFPAEDVKVVDKGMYVVYYTIPRLPSDNDWWNVYAALKSRGVTLRPDPHGTIRACLTIMPSAEAQQREWQEAVREDRNKQRELFRKEFSDAGWQAERILDAADQATDFYLQAVQQIRMSRWSKGRVVCLGDAAFAPTPLSGMGTSLAITAAYVLAGELTKLAKGDHPARALEAYETAYRPFVEKIQRLPSFVPGIAHPATAWKRWLLQALIWVVSKVLATLWVGRRSNETEEDFPLPHYPKIDEAIE